MMNQTTSSLSHAHRFVILAGLTYSLVLSVNQSAHAQLESNRGSDGVRNADRGVSSGVSSGIGDGWQVQPQILSAVPAIVGDAFGSSVAMNEAGTILVVGAADAVVEEMVAVGVVHIFTYSAATHAWVHVQRLELPPKVIGGEPFGTPGLALFGWSVAISDSTIVVGAPIVTLPQSPSLAGRAYVFQQNPDDDLWGNPLGESRIANKILVALDPEMIGYFGGSVAVDVVSPTDTRIAVGSPFRGTANQGAVYVFEGSGNTFVQKQRIIPEDVIAQDQFGSKVAIDENVLVVGVQSADTDDEVNVGAAYVYRRSMDAPGITGTWPTTHEAILTKSSGASEDGFGSSVSVLGDSIAVGAPGTDYHPLGGTGETGGTSVNEGSAFIFRRSAGSWIATGEVFARESNAGNAFGYSVALSNNGDQLIVGCPGYETVAQWGVNAGVCFAFDRAIGGAWSIQTSDLWTPSARARQGVGEQLAVSRDGDKAVWGSRHNVSGGQLSVPIATTMFASNFEQTPTASGTVFLGSLPTTAHAPGADLFDPGIDTTATGTGGITPSTGGIGSSTTPTPAMPAIEEWGVVRASVIAINRAQSLISVILTDGNGQLETGSKSIYPLGFYDPTWSVLGVGDVNGDGSSDVLFLFPNRKVKAWIRLGHTIEERPMTVGTATEGDRCMGIGDWTNNGFESPAFLHADGKTANFWIVQGGAVTSKIEFELGDGPWSFRTADTNGDSRGEIIARNGDTKRLVSLTVATDGTAKITEIANPGGNSILAAAQDFDGDGTVDFLWEDQDSHKLEFYFRNTDGTIRFQTPWDSNLSGWQIDSGSAFTTGAGTGVMFSKGGAEVLVLTVRFEALTTLPAGRGNIRVDYSRVIGEMEKGYSILGAADEP